MLRTILQNASWNWDSWKDKVAVLRTERRMHFVVLHQRIAAHCSLPLVGHVHQSEHVPIQVRAFRCLSHTHISETEGIAMKNAGRCSQNVLGKKRSMTTFWLRMPAIFRMVAAGNFNIFKCYKRLEARTALNAAALSTYTKIEVKMNSRTLHSTAHKMQVMCKPCL